MFLLLYDAVAMVLGVLAIKCDMKINVFVMVIDEQQCRVKLLTMVDIIVPLFKRAFAFCTEC
jgi:hypothetical protein